MRKKKVQSPFAKNLKAVMVERQLTVRGVAELAGVSASVTQDWLSGTIPHDLQAVAKVAGALKIDFQWLLTGTHAVAGIHDLSLSEIFDIENDPAFSGIFVLEAKRLKRKGGRQ